MPTNTDAIEALIVYLMRKLGLSSVTLSDELIAASGKRTNVSVERNHTTKVATFKLKERE